MLTLLLAQFQNPPTLILFFTAALSFSLHDTVDAFIILAILLLSGILGFWQERSAVEKLLAIVQIKAAVLRHGIPKEIPVEEVVLGDTVILNLGEIVPEDGSSGIQRSLDGDTWREWQRQGDCHQHRQGNRGRRGV